MRNKEEVDQTVIRLQEVKTHVPMITLFGDNNWASIETAIEVLEDCDTHEDVVNKHGLSPQAIYSSAFDAWYWKNGETDDNPAQVWEESFSPKE